METFEHCGLSFGYELLPDDVLREPWREEDGHGPVSDWRRAGYNGRIPTAPGEKVLHRDGSHALVYHWRAAYEKAKREGWGLADDARADLARKLGREPSKRELAAAAVDADFDRLRRYCDEDWCYCVLRVVLLDVDGAETDECEYLGGIESDSGEAYIMELAENMAAEIAGRIGPVSQLPGPIVRLAP